jgi:ADP-ribosyl-[dinitrogen reductase] hydrolase
MLGAIFGDIAGSVYEFNNIKTTEFDLLGKGTTFTDDSILTIAVAYWLLDGSLTKERLAFTLSYFVKKYPSPMGSYGSRFLQWAHGDISKPYNSWGNGSAMRVSPVGWAFDTLEETEKIAALTAEVTHNHPEGIKGAQATAAAIYMARNLATKAEIKQYIETKYGYNLSLSCNDIRPTYQFNESCQETVPQAIIAFLDSVDFESAIRLAVSLGGDSDTLACITGGIAEAFYGMTESIPETTEHYSHNTVYFKEKVQEKLPIDLSSTVDEFYEKIINKNLRFRGKNDSATVWKQVNWRQVSFEDKVLTEESYKSFLLGYGPDWDMRYGVYYEDGWSYIYRSYFLIKKFRFKKQNDGLYHVSDLYDSDKVVEFDVLEDILWHGYFQQPFSYKNRVGK